MAVRIVPGFDRYMVSDQGDVYSIREGSLKKLAARLHKGYLHVQVKTAPGRRHQRKVPVHQLVLLAYKGERPASAELGRHLDGDVMNNTPGNLEWGTYKDNIADAIRHGTHVSVTKVTAGQRRAPKGV